MLQPNVPEALSFEDVIVVPRYSGVLPSEVNVHTYLTATVRLHIPFVSAAMDTVTEDRTARAMALHGGIGVIHKNSSIIDQAAQVAKVKRAQSKMIVEPITISPERSVRDAVALMKKHGINGLPVCRRMQPVGIITGRDIRFEENLDQPVANIMTPAEKLVTAHEGIDEAGARVLLQHHRIEKLLIVDSRDNLVGLITVKDLLRNEQFPNAVTDTRGRLLVAAAVSPAKDVTERIETLLEAEVDVLVIDTAHGDSKNVVTLVEATKKRHPHIPLIAGNVVTADGTKRLIGAGADVIKVGMGPGSICTTRIVAGVGMPQITAIAECAEAAEQTDTKVRIIADGGIKFSGDIVKAIAAGADVVMIGSLFAGTDEAPGEIVMRDGHQCKMYRGMGSLAAMRQGSRDRYGQGGTPDAKLVPEGIESVVPYQGPLADKLDQLVGGLRAGMGYTGSATIEDLQNNATFVRQTSAGASESHPSLAIAVEAPNYRR